MHIWLIAGLLLPWLTAAVLALWPARADRMARHGALAGSILTVATLTIAWSRWTPTVDFRTLERITWLPEAGLELVLAVDGLSFLFLFLTCWVSALVTWFSGPYLPHAQHEEDSRRREATFYALLSAFTGSMLAMVVSGHVLQFYAFWELTSLASFLLIGFWNHHAAARAGAMRSLGLTTVGSLLMLVGLIGLAHALGTWHLQEVLARREAWPAIPGAWLWTALILMGALSKSAQVPFSAWLPGAMAAPTPVSAFLHSAALVAAGIYLLARLFPVLSAVPIWQWLLIPSGLVGGLLGGFMALRQGEIKALLAYSTISQYAFIVLAFGLGSVTGAQAGLYAFFVHAFIKAGLFLVSGAVTYLTGEKSFHALGGLARRQPMLAALATVLALSLGGLPIFGGFYYKEELLHAALDQEAWLLLGSMLVGGGLTFFYMLRFFDEIFAGDGPPTPIATPLPPSMLAAIALLAGVSLLTGLAPNWMNRALLDPAISSVLQRPATFSVELKLGGLFLMSLAILAIAAGVWNLWRRSPVPWMRYVPLPEQLSFGGGRLLRLYAFLSRKALGLHSGNLREYLRWELLAALALMAILWQPVTWGPFAWDVPIDWPVTVMLGVALLAASATIWLRYHVLAVIALTLSGYSLAVVFALMHAPDVALAQVLVETLATFSIVLALGRSRQVRPDATKILSAGRTDWRRWSLSLALGGIVGWLTFWSSRHFPPESLGGRYAREGFPLTGMHDLVTAILTDFRALDTLVEILVFAAAAFAVRALFKRPEVSHE